MQNTFEQLANEQLAAWDGQADYAQAASVLRAILTEYQASGIESAARLAKQQVSGAATYRARMIALACYEELADK